MWFIFYSWCIPTGGFSAMLDIENVVSYLLDFIYMQPLYKACALRSWIMTRAAGPTRCEAKFQQTKNETQPFCAPWFEGCQPEPDWPQIK